MPNLITRRNLFSLVALAVLIAGVPVALAQAPIGSFTIQLVNKITRQPLDTNLPPYPWIGLEVCGDDATCNDLLDTFNLYTDATGHATVTHDAYGTPLPAGYFRVYAYTGEESSEPIQETYSPIYKVEPGQHFDARTHGVYGTALSIRLSTVCTEIGDTWQSCPIKVQVTNAMSPRQRLTVQIWLSGWVTTDVGITNFPIGGEPQRVVLDPAEGTTLSFPVRIPGATLAPGSGFCARINVGLGDRPYFRPWSYETGPFSARTPPPGIEALCLTRVTPAA